MRYTGILFLLTLASLLGFTAMIILAAYVLGCKRGRFPHKWMAGLLGGAFLCLLGVKLLAL